MALPRPAALRLALPLLALAACAEPPAQVVSARSHAETAHHAETAQIAPAAASAPQRPVSRMPITLNQPLGLTHLPGWAPVAPAPMPNRDIEAPRDRFATSLAPTLEPMMLPPERRQGTTFGGEHLRETGPDRPLDNFVPGARLRIPFEGTPTR